MTTLLLLLWTGAAPAAELSVHEKSNPIYRQLLTEGVALTPKQRVPLPAPTMSDGLDGKGQQIVIKNLVPAEIEIENFLDDVLTAPQVLRRPAEKKVDPATLIRSFDLYFIAHGELTNLANTAVLERLIASDRRPGGLPRTLTAEELKARGIIIPEGAAKSEGFRYLIANIMVRVQVRAAGHFSWSQSPDSIVIAAELDDRFATDPEFPNQWRALIKEGDDEVKEGPPRPYRGAAYYVKITRLKEPAGALFVETHVVFSEPVKWFDGENVMRSKLPAATMALIRHFRREVFRANNKQPAKG